VTKVSSTLTRVSVYWPSSSGHKPRTCMISHPHASSGVSWKRHYIYTSKNDFSHTSHWKGLSPVDYTRSYVYLLIANNRVVNDWTPHVTWWTTPCEFSGASLSIDHLRSMIRHKRVRQYRRQRRFIVSTSSTDTHTHTHGQKPYYRSEVCVVYCSLTTVYIWGTTSVWNYGNIQVTLAEAVKIIIFCVYELNLKLKVVCVTVLCIINAIHTSIYLSIPSCCLSSLLINRNCYKKKLQYRYF